ncbi:hypothetical protein NAF17_05860 [Mucilaginibacter sp. RB4R14]|uniref:SDR family NAD(P)-dependent oxidoreductase n=1 Tax=Mucilaginibacter aurantiaciroseus TaxID=2949308 RepID=UPI0020912149|nr:SDR family NAD(P)-dependent oxidoreductase [Mucilaginibacter aurantiaciroseus]MCO5935055.1 hypothetical protein [Mucilaginibacter aurantiaciroseus]
MDPQKLNGQILLVTGADSVISKGVAIAIAKAGAMILINYVHNANAFNKVVAEINTVGGESFAYKADASEEEKV